MNLSFNLQTIIIHYFDYCEDQYILPLFLKPKNLKKIWFK